MPDGETLGWMWKVGAGVAVASLVWQILSPRDLVASLRRIVARDTLALDRSERRQNDEANPIEHAPETVQPFTALWLGMGAAVATWYYLDWGGDNIRPFIRYAGTGIAVLSLLSFLRQPMGEVGQAPQPDTEEDFPRWAKIAGFLIGILMAATG